MFSYLASVAAFENPGLPCCAQIPLRQPKVRKVCGESCLHHLVSPKPCCAEFALSPQQKAGALPKGLEKDDQHKLMEY